MKFVERLHFFDLQEALLVYPTAELVLGAVSLSRNI